MENNKNFIKNKDKISEFKLDPNIYKKKSKSKPPKWMDCVWRRISCGRDICPICGEIKKADLRRKNNNNIKIVLEDMSKSLKKVLNQIKKDAKKMGIDIVNLEKIGDPPEPDKFLLYLKIKDWRDKMMSAIHKAEQIHEIWIYTEAFQDLIWYINLLPVKVYRQLCNKWHIANNNDYGDYDYEYTKYVLKECSKIIKKSLGTVMTFDSLEKEILVINAAMLMSLEKEIKKI